MSVVSWQMPMITVVYKSVHPLNPSLLCRNIIKYSDSSVDTTDQQQNLFPLFALTKK